MIDYSWSGNNLSALAEVHDIPTPNFSLFFCKPFTLYAVHRPMWKPKRVKWCVDLSNSRGQATTRNIPGVFNRLSLAKSQYSCCSYRSYTQQQKYSRSTTTEFVLLGHGPLSLKSTILSIYTQTLGQSQLQEGSTILAFWHQLPYGVQMALTKSM